MWHEGLHRWIKEVVKYTVIGINGTATATCDFCLCGQYDH